MGPPRTNLYATPVFRISERTYNSGRGNRLNEVLTPPEKMDLVEGQD